MLALAVSAEAIDQEQWQAVTSTDGGFAVQMPPGEVFYFREELKTAKGTPFTLHQYVVDQGEGKATFVAQGGAYPSDLDVSNPKSILEQTLRKGARKLDGGNWNSVTWSAQQGAVTVEFDGVQGEIDSRAFSALKGRNFYDLIYWGARGAATSSDADRFFTSLKIGTETPPRFLPEPLRRDRP